MLNEALSELTETERRIVIYYLETRLQPKQLAESLNVSVRTVYKALYKYRKALKKRGIDPSELYLLKKPAKQDSILQTTDKEATAVDLEKIRSMVREIVEEHLAKLGILENEKSNNIGKGSPDPNEKVYLSKIDEVIYLLREINRNIQELQRELSRASTPIRTERLKRIVSVRDGRVELPSFVENNPWLEVLSLRKT